MSFHENQFSIRRPLHEESIGQVHDAMENLPPGMVAPRADRGLGLTLIERSFISHNMGRRRWHAPQTRYDEIFRPIVRSSLEQQDLRVNDVRYFGRNLGRISLALVLDDADEVLSHEHAAYSKRIQPIKKMGSLAFVPHITVGSIPYEHATSSLLSTLEENMPETITLQPVQTKDIRYLPYTMQEAISFHNGIAPPERPVHVSSQPNHEPSTLPMLLSHPIEFLHSLRREREVTADMDIVE